MQQFIQNPLQIITDPSGIQYVVPGDIVQLHVTIINQGELSAVIDLFLDEGLQSLTRSNISHRESLALDPKQSHEVTFEYEIPIDALAGTYDYTLVVDSPIHYPQYTPINFPRQIKVLLKEQTVVRQNDPTFSLLPATNPNKPLIFKQGEPLLVQVTVENRSNRVDRFRLLCPDLDEQWFSITYPTTGSEAQGLLGVTALELLPGDIGQIKLVFHPPTNTFAGNYSPTIRLHSENSPDLVLLELVYILIPTIYRLDVELKTILGKVSRTSGKYEVILTNEGNTVREVALKAKTIDESELCKYKYEPDKLRLLPSKESRSNLTVTPLYWWRRSLFGKGQYLNFEVKVKDTQDLPINNTLPQGSLLWKARPWWQFLVLILLILALLGGVGFIIWRILNPDPLKIASFETNAPQIVEGNNKVTLNWDIYNYKQLQKLSVMQIQPVRKEPLEVYDNINELINPKNKNQAPLCVTVFQKELLSCKNITTGVSIKGKYTLELRAEYRKNIPLIPQTNQIATQKTDVEIVERPKAEVQAFNTNKPEYRNGEAIYFNWEIKRPTELKTLEIIRKTEDGRLVDSKNFNFKEGGIVPENLKKLCSSDSKNQFLSCKKIPFPTSTPGNFTFELKVSSQGSDRENN
jgi:hypothetical protein